LRPTREAAAQAAGIQRRNNVYIQAEAAGRMDWDVVRGNFQADEE